MNDYLYIANEAAIEAGNKILKIYKNEFKFDIKEDKSPFTKNPC